MKKRIIIISGIVIFLVVVIGLIIFIFQKSSKPKSVVAFVIDDWGYNLNNIDKVIEIQRPLTLSILPNLRYSKDIAERVKKERLYDVILHLPMESKSNRAAEVNTIRRSMDDGKILAILKENIKSLPGIVGVSNHQGSKATEDKSVMRIIMGEMKKNNLFFLDSLTTPNSVCSDIAREVGIRFIERDVFLDLTDKKNSKEVESYIKGQMQELASIAIQNGCAVGIGHNKKLTLKVIKEYIPELEKEGIKIVPLKNLVR